MSAIVRPTVVIAPFANERIREWPVEQFRRFIELVLEDHDPQVLIVGTRPQRQRANELVRNFSTRDVVNTCGTFTWKELVDAINSATFVVANNSGVAHLAAAAGRWTLCVFAASHSWREWRPEGPKAVTVLKQTVCAPCELGPFPCPNGLECLVGLEAEKAFMGLRRVMVEQGEWPGERVLSGRVERPHSLNEGRHNA